MGATLTFLYQSLATDAPVKKTKAQRQLEGIDGGQAKMDAQVDEQWKQAAAGAAKGSNNRAALREAAAADVAEQPKADAGSSGMVSRRKRVIVLADGNGKWNTGVWPGWGYDYPADVTLNWAAAGVVVKKQCSAQCEFTRDQARTREADAWIGELVNHPKFGIPRSEPIAWPAEHERRDNPKALAPGAKPTQIPSRLPLIGTFYYEPEQAYPEYTLASEAIRKKIDFSITPSKSRSTLPISMVCPWGKSAYDFVRPPPAKVSGRFVAYFNEHGVINSYGRYIDRLFEILEERGKRARAAAVDSGDKQQQSQEQTSPAGIHSFINRRNMETPLEARGEPYQLSNRIAFMGTYKFVLATEPVEEEDWVEPELSQIFLSGAVPIYLGAPNAVLYAPGPRSFVHVRDFKTPELLADYLEQFRGDDEATVALYKREFFAWKEKAMATFMMDEQGQNNPIGTGNGVVPASRGFSSLVLSKNLQAFQPVPGSSSSSAVELLPAVKERVDKASTSTQERFDFVCEAAWRNFRRRLDQCVHYAECRVCELVTLLTA